jgi:hypothetical protein
MIHFTPFTATLPPFQPGLAEPVWVFEFEFLPVKGRILLSKSQLPVSLVIFRPGYVIQVVSRGGVVVGKGKA